MRPRGLCPEIEVVARVVNHIQSRMPLHQAEHIPRMPLPEQPSDLAQKPVHTDVSSNARSLIAAYVAVVDLTSDAESAPSNPITEDGIGGKEMVQAATPTKSGKLREYIEKFDQTTLLEMSRMLSQESVAIVETQTSALFGDIRKLQEQMQSAVGQDVNSYEDLMNRVQVKPFLYQCRWFCSMSRLACHFGLHSVRFYGFCDVITDGHAWYTVLCNSILHTVIMSIYNGCMLDANHNVLSCAAILLIYGFICLSLLLISC